MLGVPVYLLMLWSADDADLKGVTASQAANLSGMLADLLHALDSEGGTADGAADH